MKIYKVDLYTKTQSSIGAIYTDSLRVAKRDFDKFKKQVGDNLDMRSEIRTYEVPVTKKGLLWILNVTASHPDNG